MAQLLTAIGGSVMVSMVGKEVLLQTISETAKGIYSVGKYAAIYSTTYPNVSLVYKRLDLLATIRVIEALMNDIASNEKINSGLSKESDCVNVSLDNIRETLEELHSEMNKVNKILDYHAQKYFNSWRSLDLSMELDKIELIYETLLKRLELFTKIHSIVH